MCFIYMSLVCNLSCTSWAPAHVMRFCRATSFNRCTLRKPTTVFICAEHPVAEGLENRVAVYFDFCFLLLTVAFVCVLYLRINVHVCSFAQNDEELIKHVFCMFCGVLSLVCVNLVHLKHAKSSLSQSDSVSCSLCLCSGSVRHREIKKMNEGASYVFSCPRNRHQMRMWNF